MVYKMPTRPTSTLIPAPAITLEKASFFPKVYGWMALGLLVSAVASFGLLSSPAAMKFVFGSKVVFFGLILGELGLEDLRQSVVTHEEDLRAHLFAGAHAGAALVVDAHFQLAGHGRSLHRPPFDPPSLRQ